MVTRSTNNDLSNEIGEIKGMAIAILRELDQAREDRKERDDAIDSRLTHFDSSLNIAAQVASQARDKAGKLEEKFTNLENTITNDIKPETDKLKRLTLKGVGFIAGAVLVANIAATPVWAAISGTLTEIGKAFK